MSIRELRKWWQIKTGRVETPLDSVVPFWLVSLLFHLGLIVLLAKFLLPEKADKLLQLSLDQPDAIVDLEKSPEVELNELEIDETGMESDHGVEAAIGQAPNLVMDQQPKIDFESAAHDVGEFVTDLEFTEATAENKNDFVVKGSVGNVALGASGAVDRITIEIMESLKQRPTTVVWLFDQSSSMIKQREEIRNRFEKIYAEVETLIDAGHAAAETDSDDSPLLTQVYAFGAKVEKLLPKPTTEVSRIIQKIEDVKRDDTGIENVLTALITAATDHVIDRRKTSKGYKRNVMLIVVSDEAGDDTGRIDETIKLCQKYEMPVFVIGVPAPFGRPETQVKWVDPDPEYDQSEQWALVSQGPETAAPERLRMDLTGDFEDLELIDSGFGPYFLTRLCYETGGIYFAVHPNRKIGRRVSMREISPYSAALKYFFDPETMKHYKPDYSSMEKYVKGVQNNPARTALVQAATFTTTGRLESPRLRFPKLDEARFVNDVTMAQRAAAIIEPQINRVFEILRAGEEARNKETSLRWKAGYDLAMGQAIAAKLRAESYNAMLAIAKTKLKFAPPKDDKTPQNNTWVLRPADTIETGSQAQKLMEKARTYLTRVVNEHPGTPWAMLAERDLNIPMGWQWQEDYTEPPSPPRPRPNNNNNNPMPRPEQPRELEMPKPRRDIPRL